MVLQASHYFMNLNTNMKQSWARIETNCENLYTRYVNRKMVRYGSQTLLKKSHPFRNDMRWMSCIFGESHWGMDQVL